MYSALVDIRNQSVNRERRDSNSLNYTLQESLVNRRSPTFRPNVSESFSDIMLSKLLQKEQMQGQRENIDRSKVSHSGTHNLSTPYPQNLSQSRSGPLTHLYSHPQTLEKCKQYTKLEEILEKPRNPNYDRVRSVTTQKCRQIAKGSKFK